MFLPAVSKTVRLQFLNNVNCAKCPTLGEGMSRTQWHQRVDAERKKVSDRDHH